MNQQTGMIRGKTIQIYYPDGNPISVMKCTSEQTMVRKL